LKEPCGSCGRYREALLDFVDRREVSDRTQVALAHLDCCEECRTEIESIALTINLLRRLGDTASQVEPRGDEVGLALREKLSRPRQTAMSGRLALGGNIVGLALVAVVVGRLALAPTAASPAFTDAGASATPAAEHRIYDPPAGPLTVGLVTGLGGHAGLDRPQAPRAVTNSPAATDRVEREHSAARSDDDPGTLPNAESPS
jgi:hypothetical protein